MSESSKIDKPKAVFSLSKAKLSFILKNEKNIFLAAFEGFLLLGLVKAQIFCKHKCFKISFKSFFLFYNHIVNQIEFFSKLEGEKQESSPEYKLFENVTFCQNKHPIDNFVKYTIKPPENSKIPFEISFNLVEFFSLIKAFKNTMFHSLNLSKNQILFFNLLCINSEIDLDLLKKNHNLIFKFITNSNNQNLIEYNDCYLEIFDYYYDLLIIYKKIHCIRL